MKGLELKNAVTNAIQQLNEIQQWKLLEFINTFFLKSYKQSSTNVQSLKEPNNINLILDESFDEEFEDISVQLIYKNSFEAKVQVGEIEKLKPKINFE